tara:strand:+ start:58 stop:1260 length:1203 start_codon:yes stop_codon:yes gene_type:complete
MKSISKKRSPLMEGLVIYFVIAIFLLVGSGVFIMLSAIPLSNWYGAQSWETVPCTIESSEVNSHSSSDGTTYSVRIRYTYAWGNATFTGDQYNFFSGSSSGRSGKEAIVSQYPAGQERRCYVNPDDPNEAVLNRDFSFGYLIGTFGLLFVTIALGMLFIRMRGPRDRGISSAGKTVAQPQQTFAPHEESLSLKAAQSGLFTMLFFLFFGLVWNGVVFTVLWSMLQENSKEIAPLLFLIPFGLVGIGVMFGVLYYALALFNPKPEMIIRPGFLPLGGGAELTWSFRGNTARISKLTITLKGEEKATYRRGTTTTTDTSVFEKVVLLDTTVAGEITLGRLSFNVPEFSAPSFEGPNNKIVWSVTVHGDIHRWPDVNETFSLPVSPLPLEHPVTHVPAEFRES